VIQRITLLIHRRVFFSTRILYHAKASLNNVIVRRVHLSRLIPALFSDLYDEIPREDLKRWSRHGIVIFGIPISGNERSFVSPGRDEEALARVYIHVYERYWGARKTTVRARHGVNSWSRWSTVIEFPGGCAIATCSRTDTSLEPRERWRGRGKEVRDGKREKENERQN